MGKSEAEINRIVAGTIDHECGSIPAAHKDTVAVCKRPDNPWTLDVEVEWDHGWGGGGTEYAFIPVTFCPFCGTKLAPAPTGKE